MYLVIFFSRNQPASLDMLQNELFRVQRLIQEPCHIIWRYQCLLNLTLNNGNYQNITQNCCDLLLNMNLISNLGNFRAIRLWVWPSKVLITAISLTESEFQRRFQNIFGFNHIFFHALFKIWVNNKVKLQKPSLLHIFYYIYSTLICPV